MNLKDNTVTHSVSMIEIKFETIETTISALDLYATYNGTCKFVNHCCLLLHLLSRHHATRDLMGNAKSIDPGQPAQSAQADHCRNF